MTADDLHARADCARRNPVVLRDGKPVVTITCDHADALAELIAAARALGDDWRHGWNLYPPRDRTVALIKALAALDGTP